MREKGGGIEVNGGYLMKDEEWVYWVHQNVECEPKFVDFMMNIAVHLKLYPIKMQIRNSLQDNMMNIL